MAGPYHARRLARRPPFLRFRPVLPHIPGASAPASASIPGTPLRLAPAGLT